jgi:hypothetical protein
MAGDPTPEACYWVAPNVCCHWSCIQLAYEEITPSQIQAAQSYHEEHLRNQPKPRSLAQIVAEGPRDENEFSSLIINHLLTEQQGYILASLGIDAFDILHANYDEGLSSILAPIFDDWNTSLGRNLFSPGESLLAA